MTSTCRIGMRLTGALALLSCAAAAGAQSLNVEAVAQLTNVRFTVYDLDPNDGVAASVSFVDDANRWRVLTWANIANGTGDDDWVYRDNVSWVNGPGDANQTLGNSGTYVSAGSYVVADALWARGRTFTTNVQSDGYAGLSTVGTPPSAIDPYFYNLRLNGRTGLRLTADASVSVRVLEQCADISCGYGYATADLYAQFSDTTISGVYSGMNVRTASRSLNRTVSASSDSPTFSNAAATQSLTLTFENPGDTTLVGRVRYSVEGIAQAAVTSAVPEPASGTLTVLGVAFLAGCSLRRGRVAVRQHRAVAAERP